MLQVTLRGRGPKKPHQVSLITPTPLLFSPQGPTEWWGCPVRDGLGRPASSGAPRLRPEAAGWPCHVHLSLRSGRGAACLPALPPSLPCPPHAPSLPTTPQPAPAGEKGVHPRVPSRGRARGARGTCAPGMHAWGARARWAEAGLLVGEAVGVGEELLRREPVLGHVAGAAADQVVRHAAARHRDPT